MNRWQSVLVMHWRDKGIWAGIPLLVLLVSFLLNLFIASLIRLEFTSGSVASLPFAVFIATAIMATHMFPFAVGLGVRRHDFFVGTALVGVAISACFALLLTVMASVESRLTGLWGGTMHFFDIPVFQHLNAVGLFWLHFTVTVSLFFAGLFIFAVWSRFGRKGLTVLFVGGPALLGVCIGLVSRYQLWETLSGLTKPQTISVLGYWLLPVIAVQALCVWGMLRRATV